MEIKWKFLKKVGFRVPGPRGPTTSGFLETSGLGTRGLGLRVRSSSYFVYDTLLQSGMPFRSCLSEGLHAVYGGSCWGPPIYGSYHNNSQNHFLHSLLNTQSQNS